MSDKQLTLLDLFNFVPNAQLVWLVSRAKPNLTLEDGSTDDFPRGTYLIYKVPDILGNVEGLFQVPYPREKPREGEDKSEKTLDTQPNS